ncbi:MAG: bifunctional phosphoglucose/phosphomannose isomerase [Flavobacteriales bacterium]|nr:bifunctional phosphoglucose/phosphomannose isomerase [Flavobacteriales bacterium]
MINLIEAFPSHVDEAIAIAEATLVKKPNHSVENVVISGLGGSGIGGTIVSQLLASHLKVPVIINKDYGIPSFVSKNTLFIASSYSGNTEETLEALSQAEAKGAEICVVTSGGQLKAMAESKEFNRFVIPSGFPPRAAFGYSSIQLFYALAGYGMVQGDFKSELKRVSTLLKSEHDHIVSEAKSIAAKLYKTIPIIYSEAGFEGVGVRFRQQINENAKMLCWHHVLPEMNHNELVGWADSYPQSCVVVFRNQGDYYRTQERMKYSYGLIGENTKEIIEIWSKGTSRIEQAYYAIHLGDFVSVFLADLKQIDPVQVDVITGLKDHLSKI